MATLDLLHTPSHQTPATAHQVDVVVPVFNEETVLEASVTRLRHFLDTRFPFSAVITIADNASTDATPAVAARIADSVPDVRVIRLDEKGRGRALRRAWTESDATVLAYMDVDLATDLDALLPLVAPIVSGHSDLAIGTRLAPGSRVVRGLRREFISRAYNTILRTTLRARFSDAQCGFKAIHRDRAATLLPLVRDESWFFDTELLVIAERAGLRIHEVPVDWVDDPDSRVEIVVTALEDLRGIARLGRSLVLRRLPLREIDPRRSVRQAPSHETGMGRQLMRFAVIGVASTLVFALLFLALRRVGMGSQASNALALILATGANTAANRRLTFGVRGRDGAIRQQAQGYAVLAIALVLTSGALWGLHATRAAPSRAVEVAVLTAANVGATLVKFVLFRSWVFRRRRRSVAKELSS